MENEYQKNNMKPVVIAVSAIVFLCAVVFLYMSRGEIYAAMNSLDLMPMPERYTELYFENHMSLPKKTVAGKPISFSFVIHNLEGATTTYPYSIYFEYPYGQRVIFGNGTTTLADGAYQTIFLSHTFTASNEQGEVIVDLTNLHQQIDFILPNNNN